MTASLQLRSGKDRSLTRRHPWIYTGAIGSIQGQPKSGETVRVLAADGRFLAWAAFSPASSIRARVWSFDEAQTIDADWISRRLSQAIGRRADFVAGHDAVRLVFGEADGLPGLVVDRYRDQIVVQFLAAGVDAWRDVIVQSLIGFTGCTNVYERSDASARQREGLESREGVLSGQAPQGPIEIDENGVRFAVDVLAGHKTGFYIDQRDNRALVAAQAGGRRVLNCFCYTGGFSLAALKGGASSVLSIDSSGPALQFARHNQQLNGFGQLGAEQCDWREDNVFDALKTLAAEGRRFDLIVLDPPKFAPSAHHVERAARAYKEINLKALRLLEPGGLLFTFSCSGAIGVELFQKIVAGAVFDAGVDMQMLRRLQAGDDHPMLMTHPEGEYLKGLMLLRV
jgi:23S rRNA (cytosine1962-C5)-methyltransferase